LALATPNSASFCHALFGASWFSLDPPRHLHLFNRQALTGLVRRAGFNRLRVFTSIRDANGAFTASRAIRAVNTFNMLGPVGPASKFAGRCVQLLEAIMKVTRPDVGEDLVVLAERDP